MPPLSQSDLLQRVGNIAQLGGTRHYTLAEGRAAGTRAIDVDTGAGLQFTLLPDRALDITRCAFKGTNLVYLGPGGETHPAYYDASGYQWLRSFAAGLMTTCGLTYFGGACKDGDEDLGLHGRIANTPASRVADVSGWRDDGRCEIEVRATVEEAVLFGHKLRLERAIRTHIGATSLVIEDAVTNFGYAPSPLMILYHLNLGYPLLDGGAELIINSSDWWPYDEYSRRGEPQRLQISDPQPGYVQQVFHYRMAGKPELLAGLVNPRLHGGLGVYVKADPRELPILNNWKMLGQGDYVTGIEPGNVHVSTRPELREQGVLPMIEPQETRRFRVEVGILEGPSAIEAFRQRAGV